MIEEEELKRTLARLEKGESVTMEINGETVTYLNPPEAAPVCAKHYFEPAGEGEGKCRDCINGIVFNPEEYHLVDGEKVRL